MLDRIIVFLIRLKLGVKKMERFQFVNQKSDDIYYFGDGCLIKMKLIKNKWKDYYDIEPSGVSLNWLLDRNCKVRKVKGE